MAGKFDPLHAWLGIPPQEQPPNYYRIFGLKLFEADPAVITAASDRVLQKLAGCADGPEGAYAQKLLPQVAAIRKCLLDPQARASYDAKLRAKTAAARPGSQPTAGNQQPAPAAPAASASANRRAAGTAPPAAAKGAPAKSPASNQAAAARSREAAALARAKPLAAPPPPPPPPAPVPPPVTEVAPPVLEAAVPAAEPAAWPVAEFEPEPYEPRSSASKRSKRGRTSGKNGAARGDQDAPESPAGRKGLRLALIATAAVVLVGGLGAGGYWLFIRKAPAGNAALAQATPQAKTPKPAEPADDNSTEASADKAGPDDSAPAAGRDATAPLAASKNLRQAKGDMASAIDPAVLAEGATAVNPADEPLLKLARDGGPVEEVAKLLAGGANVETADAGGRSLLRLAVMGGHTDLVDTLLDKSANVETTDLLGQTPLMSAAQRGDADMVAKLLSAGAKPNLQSRVASLDDSGGLTALLLAIRHNRPEVVKLLIEAKADLNLANGRGVTPLMLACWQANMPIVQMLMVREPHVDATDDQGQTALMYAVEGGSEEVLKQVLFSNEARVHAKSLSGATALGMALARKSPGMVAMLREAGKKEAPMLNF